MHLILCANIAFAFIASTVAVPATTAIATAENHQLQKLDKRSPQENAPPAPGPVPTIPDNISSFSCDTPDAPEDLTYPAQSLSDSLAKACRQKDNPVNGFPKEFVPLSTVGFVNSAGPFFLMPIIENSDPDTFVVMNSECLLATLVTKKAAVIRARQLTFKDKDGCIKSKASVNPNRVVPQRTTNATSRRTRTSKLKKRDLNTDDLEVCAATTI